MQAGTLTANHKQLVRVKPLSACIHKNSRAKSDPPHGHTLLDRQFTPDEVPDRVHSTSHH
eukprot:358378-Chlamydomonas_euryale.AAC.6